MTSGESIGSAARYPSPLRYPGGKGKVANFLKLIIAANDIAGIDYIEPYAGGSSVALSLLFEEYVSNIHINDLNAGVFHFWDLVLTDPDWLCAKISKVPLSIEEWGRQKAIYADPDSASREIGFATFYLNRTNRSGIIARGGVIGGNDQSGAWKIDARFNRQSLCARIAKVARFAPRITVSNDDALDVVSQGANAGSRLLYLDPPYYVKGSRLYDNFYQHQDHVDVCRAVRRAEGPWVVSYDATPEILDLYNGCTRLRYTLGYSASKVSQGTEVMFFSEDLVVPDVSSPAAVSTAMVTKTRLLQSSLF